MDNTDTFDSDKRGGLNTIIFDSEFKVIKLGEYKLLIITEESELEGINNDAWEYIDTR